MGIYVFVYWVILFIYFLTSDKKLCRFTRLNYALLLCNIKVC